MKTISSFSSKLLAFTLALMASVSTFASDDHSNFLCYTILTDSTVAVTGQSEYKTVPRYEYLPEDLVIPHEVTLQGKTYKVVSIDQWAFYACAMLKSVIIPHTVTFIGMSAFHYCENLADVYIPYSVTTVEGSAFAYTKWYDNLPDGEVYINNTLYRYKGTAPENTKIVVNDGTTRIAGFSFWNQSNIVSVELPQSLTVIEHNTFEGCTQLDRILIPYNVTYIGANAFADCTSLSTVTCIAPTPPTMGQFANPSSNSEIFARIDVSNATLYVPAESVDAYKNAEQWKAFGQILPIKPLTAEDLFPTLTGLQRTEVKVHTTGVDAPHIVSFDEYTHYVPYNKQRIYLTNDGLTFLREENNQVLLYAPSYGIKEDVVLYDWTLEVGDTLPYNKYTVLKEADFIVTNVSTITLLDGKEYKKWTLACGIEYIEGIGAINGEGFGNYFCIQHTAHPATYIDTRLVCASRNGKLLYQMDDAEMERFGTECLCDVEKKWSDTWCNQWNILSHGYQGPQNPLVAARTSIFWLSNNTVNRDGQEYIPLMCSSSRPDVESTNLIGELRFTEDKQVYFYYDNTEYLLYDFDVQVGDTLDIFGGIELYSYSFVEQKTYPHVITKIDTLDDGRLQITSDAIVIFEDGEVGTFEEKQQQIWIEGLGSTNGIVYTSINPGIAGDAAIVMLCAYRDDECVYKTDSNDPYWIDYTQLGCVYNEGDFIEGAFPILSGLQRTVYDEFCGEAEIGAVYTGKQTFDKIFFENNKPYILCNDYLLREEDNKILIYSQLLNKDLVLYDFTLEVGDSLPALYIDYHARNAMDWIPYNPDVVDYNIDFDGTIYPADTFVVTDISNVTLLDGKEYKKWTFDNGMEYVEGIGMYGGHRNGNFFGLIQEVVVPCHIGTHLVCVSKNNKLLYQMDDAEMERLGAECLCDYDSGHRKDNAKDGQIGGRPTPTQWNQLEVVLREMDNNHTILQAETFSYTLEDISQQVNNKTYFQLARQSTKDTATTKSVVGALHFGKDEDNRVYFLRDGVEYVLYDFTAEPGDTVEIFAGINNYPQETTYTHVVTGKDTLENGACRMLLEVVFPDETNTTAENAEKVWLAGLGSVDGIVHNAAKRTSNAHAAPSRTAHSSDTQTSVMLCAWREDSCLYTTDHPDYDSFGCVYNQDPTSVENTHSPLPMTNCQKIIRNEQLLILHEGKTYNVLGVAVE